MSIEKTIYRAIQRLGVEISRDIQRKGLEDTGAAQQFNVNITGNKIQLIGVNYIDYLVNGRPPGKFPPVDKIREYVRRNGIQMEIDGRILTEDQAAYVIGRSIALEGTKIFRGEKQGVELEKIVDNWTKKLLKDIGNNAVEKVKTELKI